MIALEIEVEAPGWAGLGDVEALCRRAAEAALSALPSRPAGDLSATVLLADDEAVRELNRAWRGQDKATNVLSFPAPERMPGSGSSPASRTEHPHPARGRAPLPLEGRGDSARRPSGGGGLDGSRTGTTPTPVGFADSALPSRGRDEPRLRSDPIPHDEEHGCDEPETGTRSTCHLGDIVLAWETVAHEAAQERKAVADHAAHLVVHGLLHLLGHDHGTDSEAEAMEGLEVAALARLGIADPYREPA